MIPQEINEAVARCSNPKHQPSSLSKVDEKIREIVNKNYSGLNVLARENDLRILVELAKSSNG